jgi:hypothetical protein
LTAIRCIRDAHEASIKIRAKGELENALRLGIVAFFLEDEGMSALGESIRTAAGYLVFLLSSPHFWIP